MARRSWRRLIEPGTALVAAALGVAAVLFVLLGPFYSVASESISPDGTVTHTFGTGSVLGSGVDPVTAVVLAVAFLGSVGIGLGGLVHARTRARIGRVLEAVSTVAVLIIAILGALSIGIFFLPTVALALVSLAAGAGPPPPVTAWPRP